jgi:ubiquitin-protein ligase/predicted HAD superfamily Cof-like phosphohydrolase
MMKRVAKDFNALNDPDSGIYAKLLNDDLGKIYMMLIGPEETPYEGALFFFTIEHSKQYAGGTGGYPAYPPKVIHYSPYSVRIHPNLYTPQGTGKVCLSILGTWEGPGWTAMMTFTTIAQTILSILDHEPLRNEPGYVKGHEDVVKKYTDYVRYVTLRETIENVLSADDNIVLSVSGMPDIPFYKIFANEMKAIAMTRYQKYYTLIASLMGKSIGKKIGSGAYGCRKYVGEQYDYTKTLTEIKKLKSTAEELLRKKMTCEFNRTQGNPKWSYLEASLMKDDEYNYTLLTGRVESGEKNPIYDLSFVVKPNDNDRVTGFLENEFKMSNAHKVRQFTQESRGIACPTKPSPMTLDEVTFIIRMVMSELTELAQTVTPDAVSAIKLVKDSAGVDVKMGYKKPNSNVGLMADQYDAMVDAWYYMLNSAAKKGANLSSIFNVVHEANMNKRWIDGAFHRRPDGKVEKPPGWKEPNIVEEIERQCDEGAF